MIFCISLPLLNDEPRLEVLFIFQRGRYCLASDSRTRAWTELAPRGMAVALIGYDESYGHTDHLPGLRRSPGSLQIFTEPDRRTAPEDRRVRSDVFFLDTRGSRDRLPLPY